MTYHQRFSAQSERSQDIFEFSSSRSSLFKRASALLSLSACLVVGGCGYSGFALGAGTTAPAKPSEIGNWQVAATSTAGTSPFSALAGWIYEPTDTTATTQSVFQATPSGSCFASATTLPSQGGLTGTALVLNGFSVNGQYVNINATQDATASHFTGTYVVRGGCANGATGTLDGTRYAALTGTYQGALATGQTISLTTTQDAYPNGEGYFPFTSAALTANTGCLAGATIDINSSLTYVIGSAVSLALVSPNGSHLTLSGTFASDASSITVGAVKVTSGTCADTFGTGTLQRP